jgi:hypothetical protein
MRSSAELIFSALILTVSAAAAEEILNFSGLSVFRKLTREKVIFHHDRHYGSGIDCLRCHHRYEKGVNVLVHEELLPGTAAVSCVSCHRTERALERAYHRMCMGCHRDMNSEKIKTGPVMCGHCHVKKEKRP